MSDMQIGAVTLRRTRADHTTDAIIGTPASTNSEIVAETSRQVRANGPSGTMRIMPEPETIPASKAKRGESVAMGLMDTRVRTPHSSPIATETPRRIRADFEANAKRRSPVSEPIAATATKRRGKGADRWPNTNAPSPPSQPIQIGTGNGSGDNGAGCRANSNERAPHVANIEAGATIGSDARGDAPPSSTPSGGHDCNVDRDRFAAGDGGASHATDIVSPPPLHPSIPALIAMQRQRTFAIKSQQRVDRACESFIASSIGFSVDMDPAKRKDIYARAAKIRRGVEKGATVRPNADSFAPPSKRSAKAKQESDTIVTDDNAVANACSPIILTSLMARSAWDTMRNGAEKEMRRLAEGLPVWKWSVGVKGFGALGVAIIAAEASGPRGDVGSYATKERLWKRLGLAVIEGSRQRRVTDAEAAKQHGYNPRRRSEIWTIADSMFRHQWAGANEEAGTAPHPVGPYGAVYMRRKSHTEGREWTGGRRENDARRVMTKALIEDYWRVWRGLAPLAIMNKEIIP